MPEKNPNSMTMIEIAYEYKKRGLLTAEAKQVWLLFENGYKTKRAQIVSGIRIKNPTYSQTRLDSEAIATKEYQTYLEEWDSATGLYLKAQVESDAWRMYWESRRTMEATKREEIKHDVHS